MQSSLGFASTPARSTYQVSFARDPAAWRTVKGFWRAMLAESRVPHATHQTPEWLEHRARSEPGTPVLLALVRQGGTLVGVAPIMIERRQLDFAVGTVNLHAAPLRCAVILGGTPLLPPDAAAHDALLDAIADELGDCDAIDMSLLPRDAFAAAYVMASPAVQDRFLVYEPPVQGAGPLQAIHMPSSFDAYLAKFNAKSRSRFRRIVRLMREQEGYAFVRYDQPGDGAAFLEAAAHVARHTWQRRVGDRFEDGTTWPQRLVDLADHGLLRSYVLFCGGEPCAFALGVQIDGVFHYVKPGFDEARAKLSPGTVLLYSMLEDMYRARTPQTVCFCTGDAPYKRFFANGQVDTTDLLLLRRGLQNRVLMYCHAGLRGGVAQVKRWLGPRAVAEVA